MVGASYTRAVLTRIEPVFPVLGPGEIRRRLALRPAVETLLTADDIEKQREAAANPSLTQAAVLLLVVNRPGGAVVVFTQRTADLADHAGQISFPGGRAQADEEPARTALREAQEEVGIDPDAIEVLGELPDYHTSTGYRVRPVVGWAEPPVAYSPDPREVADVFEVPLAFLLDEANHRHESAYYRGRLRKYWAMPWRGRFIWGATAGMLVTFQRIVGQR
ncbi:MAG: CoA pyrophosphatase [Betaproteobacteria bacterium]|nr:CoA pyrophosphatase [Betaproteobacteria bacterium]